MREQQLSQVEMESQKKDNDNYRMKSVSNRSDTDGSTSFIMRLEPKRIAISERIRKWRRRQKRKSIERNIRPGTHTMSEVCEYLVSKYGFIEISTDSHEWNEEYTQMRTSFMMQYRPDFIGDYGQEFQSEPVNDDIKKLEDKIKHFQNLAKTVPTSDFDINPRMFKRYDNDNEMHITVEETYDYIGGGASGRNNNTIKEFGHILCDIYLYYGVTEEDIKDKSERYRNLVRECLASGKSL